MGLCRRIRAPRWLTELDENSGSRILEDPLRSSPARLTWRHIEPSAAGTAPRNWFVEDVDALDPMNRHGTSKLWRSIAAEECWGPKWYLDSAAWQYRRPPWFWIVRRHRSDHATALTVADCPSSRSGQPEWIWRRLGPRREIAVTIIPRLQCWRTAIMSHKVV